MIISKLKLFLRGVLRSYSQVFFTDYMGLSIPLLIVSFIDLPTGICGLIAVIVSNGAAALIGFDEIRIGKGLYGFNSLLVGLGLGNGFQFSPEIIAVVVIAALLTLFITITIEGLLGKYYLPFLSLPFVFAIWTALLASRLLTNLEISARGVYVLNDIFRTGGHQFIAIHSWWTSNITSTFINSFLLSLGSIFFQFNFIAGIVVAFALIVYSRIAFTLAIIGYSVAFFAYKAIGVNIETIGYGYIGFNFILTSIAIGGFFYIPNQRSYLWAILITPVIALVTVGLFGVFSVYGLPFYSLPFNLVVLMFIYSFRFRIKVGKLNEVVYQHGTPERNLYSFTSHTNRFPREGLISIHLPFYGEWAVSQGHNGSYTHKDEWAHAWDFIVTNNENEQFSGGGETANDYYCYNKNVIAPADGHIVNLVDGIDDNPIGDANLLNNWGNTVVIKHSEYLYTKLSHLKKNSFVVKNGEFIKRGQLIARVGSSGRSPYPHLHFQIQATPHIGSKTLQYPISSYVANQKSIESFGYPSEGDRVSSADPTPIVSKAFHFIPGMRLKWNCPNSEIVEWEVFTNSLNKSYLYCKKTKSVAWYVSSEAFFSFTAFEGDKSSLLFKFYKAAFRVPLVFVSGYKVIDYMPINKIFSGLPLFIQDFIAPFMLFLKANYSASLQLTGSQIDPTQAVIQSSISRIVFIREINRCNALLSITSYHHFELTDTDNNKKYICEVL